MDFTHSNISVLSNGKQVNIDGTRLDNTDSDTTSDGIKDAVWMFVGEAQTKEPIYRKR